MSMPATHRRSRARTTLGRAEMKLVLATALAFALSGAAMAQPMDSTPIDGPAHAPAGAQEIPLYGKATPGKPSDEAEMRFFGRETVLRNVTYPTLTPILPAPGRANGTAVIVASGGVFSILAMQN